MAVKSWPCITTASLKAMFKLYNNNPHNEKLSDCVCRAITLATEANYYDVMDLLKENGQKHDCQCLTCECYSKMLDDIGYKKHEVKEKTVGEIAEENKDKTLLIRIEGHLTCAKDGDIYDLWDCSGKKADFYWVID